LTGGHALPVCATDDIYMILDTARREEYYTQT